MELSEYSRLDAVALAGLIRSGEVAAAEVEQAARAALDAVDADLNSVVEWYDDPEPARPGPLSGVPFLRKDLGAAEAGRLQEMGSRLAAGLVADHESELMRRCKDAGLRVLGRSATPEFGICATTEPIVRGPTRNPWARDRSTGGSSGGAAAAVAAGIVPAAHASDAGGSIRIPASACGLVGLKVSRGRVSQAPASGESLMGLGVEFAVTRSVRDAAALLEAVAGPAPGDPFVLRAPAVPPAAPGPLRIVWSDGTGWPSNPRVDEAAVAAVGAAVTVLEAQGHRVSEGTPQYDWELYLDLMTDAFSLGVAAGAESLAAATGRPVSGEFLEPVTLAHVEHAGGLSALDVAGWESGANRIRRQVGRLFAGSEVLVTPTLTGGAVPLGLHWGMDPDITARDWNLQLESWIPFSAVFNITGQPAISLPLGTTSGGLPVGVQLVAHSGREDLLLALAAQLEEALPWADRLPPIHAG
jgi:amidase